MRGRRAYRLIAYLTRVGQTADTIMSAQRVDPPSFLPSYLSTHQLVNRLINKFLFLLQVSNSTYMAIEPQSTTPRTVRS